MDADRARSAHRNGRGRSESLSACYLFRVRPQLAKPALAVVAVLVGGAMFAGSACRDPTELTVVLTTDVVCSDLTGTFDHASIYVGTAEELTHDLKTLTPVAETVTCKGGQLGSIVVVPGKEESFALRIVGRLVNSHCETDPKSGCIEARRRLGFVPHTPLRMPIVLSTACLNKVCDGDKTCVRGECVSSVVEGSRCVGNGCDENVFDAGPADATLDSPVLVDAAADVVLDAAIDGSPPCVPLDNDAGGAALVWHFDKSMAEANGKVFAPVMPVGASFVAGASNACGFALANDGGPWILTSGHPTLSAANFSHAFWLRTTKTGATLLQSAGTPTNIGGWSLRTTVPGTLVLTFCDASKCYPGPASVAVVTDGAWHHVEFAYSGGGSSLQVDSNAPDVVGGGAYLPGNQPMVSVGIVGTLDELTLTATP